MHIIRIVRGPLGSSYTPTCSLESCVDLVPVSSGILNGTAQVDFKHCASNGFAFLRLLNPDQSNFEHDPFSVPRRPCQYVRFVGHHTVVGWSSGQLQNLG